MAAPRGMVLVPGGSYTIGSDEVDIDERAVQLGIVDNWFEHEKPEHKVKLKSFYIDRYEVTNNDYLLFINDTGYRPPKSSRARWRGRTFSPRYANEPVAFVSWDDAYNYCKWTGKRLPTEEEWESAARGSNGYIYPWGNEFDITKANVGGKRMGPVDIGAYGISPTGAYDMIGNVWEWTASWFEPYEGNDIPDDNYGKKSRVIRGNSWAGVGHYQPDDELAVLSHNSMSSFRLYLDPKGRTNDLGFRCIKSIEPFFKRLWFFK